MFNAAIPLFKDCTIAISAAAVADYAPIEIASEKVKKKAEDWNIELKKTKDVLGWIGDNKKVNQKLIGFALETENEIENAKLKLKNKNLDLIVLNSLNDEGAGFSLDTNKITIISKGNKSINFPLKDKKSVSLDIVNNIIELINE